MTSKRAGRRPTDGGFTLLEVMIALAIMAVGFASILAVQSNSINASIKARELNTVSMLAKGMLAETEAEIEGKQFNEVKTEKKEACPIPYDMYECSRVIKEVTFPKLDLTGSAGGSKGGSGSSAEGDQGLSQNQSMVDQVTKLVTKYLSKAIREITVTIEWQRGKSRQRYSVSTYWVDLNSDFQLTE